MRGLDVGLGFSAFGGSKGVTVEAMLGVIVRAVLVVLMLGVMVMLELRHAWEPVEGLSVAASDELGSDANAPSRNSWLK